MPLSYAQSQGNGTTKNFDVPCEYLAKSHITVKVDGADVPFSWLDTYRVQVTPAPAKGSVVEVRRTTPREDRLVTFTDGSTLVETDLNTSSLQSFFLAQEAFDQGAASMAVTEDGQFSALNRRITLVSDPVNDQDVVTKKWAVDTVNTNVGLAIDAKNQSLAARDASNAYRASAANERTLSETARTGAEAARNAAITAKDQAVTAKDAAVVARSDAQAARSGAENARSETEAAKTAALEAKVKAETAATAIGTLTADAEANGFMRRNSSNTGWDYLNATETCQAIGAITADEVPSGLVDVSIADFNPVGDGVADDKAAFDAAFASLGFAGGRVLLGRGKRYRVSTLNVPTNCQIIGSYESSNRPGSNRGNVDYMGQGAILVDGTGMITMNANTGLHGVLIRRTGQAIPSAGPTGWTGIAVRVVSDDVTITNSTILCFSKAIVATQAQRLKLLDLSLDCLSGVDVSDTWDIPYMNRVHCWPFATIHYPGDYPYTYMIRSGTAFNIHDGVDWAKLTDCFSYGYKVGYLMQSVNNTTLVSCSADNAFNSVPLHEASVGFIVSGTSLDTRFIGCQAAAQHQAGVYIAHDAADQVTFLDGLSVWGKSAHAVLIGGAGNVNVVNGNFHDATNGISLENNKVSLRVTNTHMRAIAEEFVHAPQGSIVTLFGNDFQGAYGQKPATSAGVPTLVGSDPVKLPPNNDTVVVTGNFAFGQMFGAAPGRRVTLIFTGTGTVYSSNDANGLALTSASMAFSPNRAVTFVSDGSRWFLG